MYRGNLTRKQTLIDFGFRLPSALDNRPLKFNEFLSKINQVVFVSATPADYERNKSGQIVEQIVRPTGLIDPAIEVHPVEGQIDHLKAEISELVLQGSLLEKDIRESEAIRKKSE